MSVSEEHAVQPSATTVILQPPADPAPLGLAGFATTTFLLSAANAGWMGKASGAAFLGYAFAYGGLCQLLAGMWEFRNRNVFGAAAFSTYGGFWIGLGLWVLLVAPKDTAAQAGYDKAWIVLAFAIVNTYLLILSTQINMAVFMVFLTLEVTELLLFIGGFASSSGLVKAGGYIGVLTAIVAWYTSAAFISRGMAGGKLVFPVGKALIS